MPNALPRLAFPDEHRWQMSDTLSKLIGNHNLKAGVRHQPHSRVLGRTSSRVAVSIATLLNNQCANPARQGINPCTGTVDNPTASIPLTQPSAARKLPSTIGCKDVYGLNGGQPL